MFLLCLDVVARPRNRITAAGTVPDFGTLDRLTRGCLATRRLVAEAKRNTGKP